MMIQTTTAATEAPLLLSGAFFCAGEVWGRRAAGRSWLFFCGRSRPTARRTAFSVWTSRWAKDPACPLSFSPSWRTAAAAVLRGWL